MKYKMVYIDMDGTLLSKDKNNNNIIYGKSIPNLDCLEIIEALNRYKISFQMYTNDTIYCSNQITKVATKIFMTNQVGYNALKINYVKVRKIKKWRKFYKT
ncbi:MAG: HAD hydrolase family protein [Clostridium sp.]